MNPFIPLKSADLAIVDARLNREAEEKINELGIETIKTIKCESVDRSIAYHPDIVIHPLNHNTLVICPDVFQYYKDTLKGSGINLIKGEKSLGKEYPEDIAYNVGRLGNFAIHNFKHTDPVLKYHLKKENLEFLNIKQGYSKCSLAILGENTAMTADIPLYKKLKDLNFQVLLIDRGHVQLEGQKYGFIGGVNGNVNKGHVIFSGNMEDHPDRKKIMDFINKNNIKFTFLSEENLVDVGTIITLNKF